MEHRPPRIAEGAHPELVLPLELEMLGDLIEGLDDGEAIETHPMASARQHNSSSSTSLVTAPMPAGT